MITKELFYVTGNIEAFLPTIFCHGKATSITHSDSLAVALIIQYAMCMLRIIMPSETCMAVPYFSALSHEGYAFRKKKSHWTWKFVFWFCLQIFWAMSRSGKNWATYCHKRALVLMCSTCYFCQILSKLKHFLYRFSGNRRISNFTISLPWETSRSMRSDRGTDRQTEVTKLVIVIRHLHTAYCSCSAVRRS